MLKVADALISRNILLHLEWLPKEIFITIIYIMQIEEV